MCLLCRNALVPEKEPKVLDCQHSFCRDCITEIGICNDELDLIKSEYSGVVNCPACKVPTILSSIDGVDGLPNFFARRDEAKKPHSRQEGFEMYNSSFDLTKSN